MPRPNILFITTDQHRFDTLGCHGHPLVKTPHLDALAADGLDFTRAFVQNPVCVPSRACLQTGRYTHQHGVTYMEEVIDSTPGLPSWEPTYMEQLQAHGYATAAMGKIHMYPEKGFDRQELTGGKGVRWLQAQGQRIGPAPLGPAYAAWLEAKRPGAYESIYAARRAQEPYRDIGLFENPLSNAEYVETWIAERSAQVLRERPADRPFFLWSGFCGPHDPWDPPEPYRSLYRPEDQTLPDEFPGWPSWRGRWDEAAVRRMRAYYLGMVTCIDDHIGRLLGELRTSGLYDETLIIFTTDHGEFLGERGRTGKGLFFDSILRVPFIIKPPRSTGFRPRRLDQVTENFNLAPTILDYAGLTPPAAMTARSLRPLIEDRPGAAAACRPAAFSEFASHDRLTRGKCIRTATHKYVRWLPSGREELYELAGDPLEKENLATSAALAGEKAALKDALYDWLAETGPAQHPAGAP